MSYVAAVLQPTVRQAYGPTGPLRVDEIAANIATAQRLTMRAADEHGARLIVLPEFFLTGFAPGRSVADWIAASVSLSGRELDALAATASALGVHIAGSVYERIDAYPGRFFNTAFVIGPQGDRLLAYRKLYAMTAKTRPTDVLDDWLDRFGPESLFPTVRTELGTLGAMIARDSHWPEVARCLCLRGAEVIVNPCAAMLEPQTAGRFARQSRAYENHAYVVAANIGPLVGPGSETLPTARAPSEIVGPDGMTLAASIGDQEEIVCAEIDLAGLRQGRTGGGNMVAQLHAGVHAAVYASVAHQLFASNRWADRPIGDERENQQVEAEAIARMLASGLLTPPGTASG